MMSTALGATTHLKETAMKKLDKETVGTFLISAISFLLSFANATVYQPGRIIHLVFAGVTFAIGVFFLVISVALWCVSGDHNA